MAISQYKVGAIPRNGLGITILDSRGRSLDISDYSDIRVRIMDPENNEVDLTGSSINLGGVTVGRIMFEWPTSHSLFLCAGTYLLEVILSDGLHIDITSEHTIQVTKLGGNY